MYKTQCSPEEAASVSPSSNHTPIQVHLSLPRLNSNHNHKIIWAQAAAVEGLETRLHSIITEELLHQPLHHPLIKDAQFIWSQESKSDKRKIKLIQLFSRLVLKFYSQSPNKMKYWTAHFIQLLKLLCESSRASSFVKTQSLYNRVICLILTNKVEKLLVKNISGS